MDNSTTEGQGIFISRQRIHATLAYGIVLIIALIGLALFSAGHPATPAGEWRGAPDPPLVDNSVKVEILSNNQLFSNNQTCIGVCK